MTKEVLAAGDAYARWVERTRLDLLPPGPALEVLRVYEGLLSVASRGRPVEEWIDRLAGTLARDGDALPDGCVLGDRSDDAMLA